LGLKKRLKVLKTQDDFDKIGTLMLAIKESAIRFNQESNLFSEIAIMLFQTH
jgi:hypothetical protein